MDLSALRRRDLVGLMPHVRIETSVPRHPKFLKAGPVACWLWLCGNCYCQDGLTDGFIPREVVPSLGLPVSRLALRDAISKLVDVRLWDACDGGWRVHDYLEHNNSADHVRTIRATNKENAQKKRGRPQRSESVSESVSESSASSLSGAVVDTVVVAAGVVVPSSEEKVIVAKVIGPRDQWWLWLIQRYPKNRVLNSQRVQDLFNEQFNKDPRSDEDVWRDMSDGLNSQREGHEWRVKGVVPNLDKWLEDGRWRQRHAVAPASARMSKATEVSLTSAAEFIKGGKRER